MDDLEFKKWSNWHDRAYIDPNDLFDDEDVSTRAFIYTNDHKMHYATNQNDSFLGPTHMMIIMNNPELRERYKNFKLRDRRGREQAHSMDLFGRVGPYLDSRVVSFWGDSPELFNKLLIPCLQKLEKDGLVLMKRDSVSTINHGTVPIREMLPATNASQQAIDQQRKQLDMHLMNPIDKKKALQDVGYAGSHMNPWQKQARQLGVTVPGQSLFARTSEAHGS